MSGKLVGINTMIFSQSGGSQGIGFAIPSNLVRLYVESAAQGRKVERPWLGARLEGVTREVAEGLGLDRLAGAVIVRISERGPAAAAGLEAGDVITHVDGFEVFDPRSAQYRLTTRGVGNTARLDVIRRGKPLTVSIKLQSPPKPGKDDVLCRPLLCLGLAYLMRIEIEHLLVVHDGFPCDIPPQRVL